MGDDSKHVNAIELTEGLITSAGRQEKSQHVPNNIAMGPDRGSKDESLTYYN